MVLKSRIWSYPGGDKYSFVDDVCPQYLHCTDEDQQSETARLSTVNLLGWVNWDPFVNPEGKSVGGVRSMYTCGWCNSNFEH